MPKKGYIMPQEYRKRRSHPAWNKGLSVKFNNCLDKWRESGGQPWNKGLVKEQNPMTGRRNSEETKAKMRIAAKERMRGKLIGIDGTQDGYGRTKIECVCKDCGVTMYRRTDSFKSWSGRCVPCAKKYRKDNTKGRVKAVTEVSCIDCNKRWNMRVDQLPKWKGYCLDCSHAHKHSTPEQKEKCRLHLKKLRSISPEKFLAKPKYGPEHWNWQGGKTTENNKVRSSKEYKEWRTQVFKRDDYTCQFCNQRGGVLHADHIKPFAKYPEFRLELSNGRTLCFECHKTTDTYGFSKKRQQTQKTA